MIYVIKGSHEGKDIYKIGTTGQCPRERMRQIQSNNLSPLELVAGLIGTREDEQMFHSTFKNHRITGEWFKDCKGIRKLIEDFNIDQWDETMESLKYEETTIEEAYQKLTILRFYDSATAKSIAESEVPKRMAAFERKSLKQ